MTAWILEVNDHPSLNIYFDKSFMGSGPKVTDDDIDPVDLYVKSRVVKDSIKIAKKKSIKETTEFGSLSQVYP